MRIKKTSEDQYHVAVKDEFTEIDEDVDGTELTKSGVAVEKLLTPKFAKIKLLPALQSIFSVHPDIFYPPNSWD
jgi:hypothetical protein